MKFLLTMNMPSAKGFLIHQITIEHAGDLEDFCNALNDNEFITVRQWYQFKQPTGDSIWQDRGELVINTSHIGKVQEYHEQENDDVQILFQVTRADENGSRDVTNVGDVKNMGNVRDVSLFLLERTSSPFSTLTKKHTKCIC